MPQQQNKMAPVRGETTVPRHHNEPLVTSHKNRDSENHRSEFLAKVRKMAKNEIIFSQSEIFSKLFVVMWLIVSIKHTSLFLLNGGIDDYVMTKYHESFS